MLSPDTPVDLQAPADGLVLNLLFFTLGGLGLVYAVVRSVRTRDPLPLLLVVGAVLAVSAEATFDLLGKIWYPANIRPRAFTMLDRPIPLFLLAGYIPWVGVLPLLLADVVERGIRARWLYVLAVSIALSNVVIDAIGTSVGTWSYYADGPLHYITTAPVLAALPLAMAWLVLVLRPRLRGAGVVAFVAVPPFALSALFAGLGWPVYAALNVDGLPVVVDVAAGLLMLAMVAGTVHLLVRALEPYGPSGSAQPERRGPHSEEVLSTHRV